MGFAGRNLRSANHNKLRCIPGGKRYPFRFPDDPTSGCRAAVTIHLVYAARIPADRREKLSFLALQKSTPNFRHLDN
jgi:hypothetical protein